MICLERSNSGEISSAIVAHVSVNWAINRIYQPEKPHALREERDRTDSILYLHLDLERSSPTRTQVQVVLLPGRVLSPMRDETISTFCRSSLRCTAGCRWV